MLVDEIWDFKSLNMGRELEIAGEFIYDSAKKATPKEPIILFTTDLLCVDIFLQHILQCLYL